MVGHATLLIQVAGLNILTVPVWSPIGAYEPRWFMKAQHQNPAEAVKGMRLCNAAYVAGHHFATIQLTNEGIEAPVAALEKALKKQGVAPEHFRALRAGEVFDVPKV